jgi:hypothetical protein
MTKIAINLRWSYSSLAILAMDYTSYYLLQAVYKSSPLKTSNFLPVVFLNTFQNDKCEVTVSVFFLRK